MPPTNGRPGANVGSVALSSHSTCNDVEIPEYSKSRLEDVGFMTAMCLTVMGNYAQTGHFGGPLAYTPYTVATHLAGPELGGI